MAVGVHRGLRAASAAYSYMAVSTVLVRNGDVLVRNGAGEQQEASGAQEEDEDAEVGLREGLQEEGGAEPEPEDEPEPEEE